MRRRLYVVLALIGVLVMFFWQPAAAYANDATVWQGQNNLLSAFDTAGIVALIIGTWLPALVALASQRHWNSGIKALLHAAVSIATAVGTQYLQAHQDHTAFMWQPAVLSAILTFITGLLTHNYMLKPLGIAAKLQNYGSTPTVNGQYVTTLTPPDTVLDDDELQRYLAGESDPVGRHANVNEDEEAVELQVDGRTITSR